MRRFPPVGLKALLTAILTASGAPEDIAGDVSASLVDSSLKGVDSHGVMRVLSYVDQIASGWIRPAARPTVETEGASIALMRGHSGFGIFALGRATELAVRKVRTSQTAAIGLIDTTHTGRLGWFAEDAARQGVVVLIVGGGGSRSAKASVRSVAPYGGRRRIFATNPYAYGVPAGRFGTVVGDFSSSMVAEGKLQMHRARRQPLPPGWILDRDGHPSTDVADFYAGGTLLPAAGHKGYALALLAELLTGCLLPSPQELNWLVIAVDAAAFRPLPEVIQTAETLLSEVKQVPPAPGFAEVLLPGEPEHRSAARLSREGVAIDDAIWRDIEALAERLNVQPPAYVDTGPQV